MIKPNLSKTPLLAGMQGEFSVESQKLKLRTVSAGSLFLKSGFLAIVDPFAEMTRGGNLGILLNQGHYDTVITQVLETESEHHSESESYIFGMASPDAFGPIYSQNVTQTIQQPKNDLTKNDLTSSFDESDSNDLPYLKMFRNAYLTLIIDKQKWIQRQSWIEQQQEKEQSCAIPKKALRFLHLTNDGQPPNEIPLDEETFIGVAISAGTCAMVDDEALKDGMPPNVKEPGWDKTLFEHGVPHSWFDQMDSNSPLPHGIANIRLPLIKNQEDDSNLILCEAGYGDGYYPVVGEYAFDPLSPESELSAHPTLIAIHVDFQVIPNDPNYPVAQNMGER